MSKNEPIETLDQIVSRCNSGKTGKCMVSMESLKAIQGAVEKLALETSQWQSTKLDDGDFSDCLTEFLYGFYPDRYPDWSAWNKP